jgi:hypothetical protein
MHQTMVVGTMAMLDTETGGRSTGRRRLRLLHLAPYTTGHLSLSFCRGRYVGRGFYGAFGDLSCSADQGTRTATPWDS